ncbi:MAG: class I SAM-dependent methyltransferase [Candidatus Hodarchaeota archaeon]
MSVEIVDVKAYWNANPCQSSLSNQQERKKYFEEISYRRFNGREWHIPIIAKFEEFKNKDILEIGCGTGTDGFEFAKNGARYVGIDLTPNSIKLAKERFKLFNVEGKFEIVNAEETLPFPDNSFDHIYSFGVIHHTPNSEAIVNEMYRVLRPGGTFNVMLYNRSSINYYIEIMFLRKLFRWILYPKFMPSLISKVTGLDEYRLNGHREIMIEKGKMTKQEWLNINTDGPYCPLAKVYNKKEAAELFKKFDNIKQQIWEFNTDHWSYIGKLIPKKIARGIGRIWGWHRIIYGTKKAEK